MNGINLKSITDGIITNLSPINNLRFIGLYPDGINRIGNNYPCYVIRFVNDYNSNDYHTMLLSTDITLQIFLYTKDNNDRVIKQNILQDQIISLLLNQPTLNTSCIMNTIFLSIDRGQYSQSVNSYNSGYYPNFNLSILSFTIKAHRSF